MSTPTPPPAATVVRDITVSATDQHGDGVDMVTRWTYDQADPYAVAVDFAPGDPGLDPWLLDRGLLLSAFLQRGYQVGEGDVWYLVWSHRCWVSLTSPDGALICSIPADVVHRFLAETYRLVPPGAESRFVDVDGLVARLLGEVSS